MDKIVVDSSVAIKWFVVEPLSSQAHRILDSYRTGALGLYAPDLMFAENSSEHTRAMSICCSRPTIG